MANSIFRQESIDQVNSQEMVKDYLRVTHPRLWMVITAVLVLLAGFFVYSSVAEQEITVPVRVNVSTFEMSEKKLLEAVFDIKPGERSNYSTGMTVRFEGVTAEISYFIETADMTEVVATADGRKAQVPDGEYDAVVVIEASTPISELFE